MRVAVVAPSRFPVREPYAGGLEAFCAQLVTALQRARIDVDFYAARGSVGHERAWEFPGVDWTGHESEATDHTYPPGEREKEDEAFARLQAHLAQERYDVVHNNSLHPGLFGLPHLLTTLHTPAFWEMQDRIAEVSDPGRFAAVSRTTASSWRLPTAPWIVPNGVDTTVWHPADPDPGRESPEIDALWFGRIIPDKGLHLAIDACRAAGLPLTVVGRSGDASYWDRELAHRDGPDITWLGEKSHAELAALVSRARVVLVTPCWDEPFGLVTIEAMACGTPVAAVPRGGVAEILSQPGAPGVLAASSEAADLADAVIAARGIGRRETADYAQVHFSLDALVGRYTRLYEEVA